MWRCVLPVIWHRRDRKGGCPMIAFASRGLLIAVLLLASALHARAAEYSASYSFEAAPKLCPGSLGVVKVTLRNTGTRVWTSGGTFPFLLAYHWHDGSKIVVWDGERTALPRDVRPGETVRLDATIKAPAKWAASYDLYWDLVQEGVFWFSTVNVPMAKQPVAMNSRMVCLARYFIEVLPQITDGPEVVEPEGIYALYGQHFGPQPGSAALIGNFAGASEVNLDVLWWFDGGAIVGVPAMTGVLDQPATIRLTTAAGKSAWWTPRFVATRDLQLLPWQDVQAQCSQIGWRNICNLVGDEPLDAKKFNPQFATTLMAGHQMPGNVVGGYDTDSISATLLNGWAFHSYSLNGGERVVGFVPGATSGSIGVEWKCPTTLCIVRYSLDVYISGPVGLPYK
jgi:hypothetical protein